MKTKWLALVFPIAIVWAAACYPPPPEVNCNNIAGGTDELVEDGGPPDGSFTCRAGTADCNRDSIDKCEVNLLADSANCGACGNVCGDARTLVQCKEGQCIQIGCKPPFTICGGEGIGCPTNLAKDWNNCGMCGNVCDVDAGESCHQGTCMGAGGGAP